MNDKRKAAYRHPLYVAMLDIRNLCQPRLTLSANPLSWRRQYLKSRAAGALGDWLHNLAAFSVREFAGFEEKRFWREGEAVANRHPEVTRYREVFDQCLNGNVLICT